MLTLARKFDYFLKFARPTAKAATIKVTEKCNSKCITCDVWKKDFSNEELSTDKILSAEKELYKLGCRSLKLTGGEALLREGIERIIDKASELGFEKVSLVTNGLLLEEKAEKLASLDKLTVSIDGMEKTNDEIRGIEGDFERSINGIKKVKELDEEIDITIATTVLAKNFSEIPDLIELCKDLDVEWHPNLLDTNLYFFDDVDFTGLEPDELSEEEIKGVIDFLKKEENLSVATVGKEEVNYIEKFLSKGNYPNHCILGYTSVYINQDGGLYSGCWVMDPIGNIKNKSIKEILNSEEYKKRIKKMFRRDCPQCTCGWTANVKFENIINELF